MNEPIKTKKPILGMSEERLLAFNALHDAAAAVCKHHDAEKIRRDNPEYVESKLLDAVERVTKAGTDELVEFLSSPESIP
jgi:hypothetical protein